MLAEEKNVKIALDGKVLANQRMNAKFANANILRYSVHNHWLHTNKCNFSQIKR